MQAGGGTVRVRCSQRQVAILGRGIEQGMACEIDQYQVIRLSAYQAEFAQLALYLIARRCFASKIDNISGLPPPALGIDEQFVKGQGIGLGKRQRNKVCCIIVIINTNY